MEAIWQLRALGGRWLVIVAVDVVSLSAGEAHGRSMIMTRSVHDREHTPAFFQLNTSTTTSTTTY